MPKSSNQKFKILYLMRMLLERTDENHPMSITQMIGELNRYGVKAERKSLYDDLEALRKYGLDIVMVKGKTTGYFLAEREFELPELKLLVDAVQCSKFITQKKSRKLIKKLEGLTSVYQAGSLHRQVCLTNRIKNINESIYINVDHLHEAIAGKKQVMFKYFDYNLKKKKEYRKNGENYQVSPYSLCWDDENYYLITYSEKHEDFIHYRVDRMSDIDILDEARIPLPRDQEFDIVKYSKRIFGMFSGEETQIELQFDNSLVNAVLDRFGKDVRINKKDEQNFTVKADIAVSSPFYAWIFQFGIKARILSPQSEADRYKEYLEKILFEYRAEE